MADTIESLKALTLDELELKYNAAARDIPVGYEFYRKEIEWRMQTEQANKIEIMASNIENLTADMSHTARHMLLMTRGMLLATLCIAAMSLLQIMGR